MKIARGSVSIFVVLSLMLIASILFTLLEGARRVELAKISQMKTYSAMESIFAGYQRTLWEEYSLLAWDEGKDHFAGIVREILDDTDTVGEVNQLWDMDLLVLKPVYAEISEYRYITDEGALCAVANAYMKQKTILEATKGLYGQYEAMQSILSGKEQSTSAVSEAKSAIESAKQAEKQQENVKDEKQEEVVHEKINIKENPLEAYEAVKGKGILGLVLPYGESISGQKINLNSTVSKRKLITGNSKEVYSDSLTDKLLLEWYLSQSLSCFTEQRAAHALAYEKEYVIAQKGTEEENLKAVVAELLATREALNLLYLSSNTEKRKEAEVVAITLVSVTGVPELIEIVKWGVLAAWAYVESILDVRELLNGGQIPLIKNDAEWQSDLLALSSSLNKKVVQKGSGRGLSYSNYLDLLLLSKSRKQLEQRSLDVMEMTVQRTDDERFRMDRMVFEAKLEMEYEYHTCFLGLEAYTKGREGKYTIDSQFFYSYRTAGV